MYSESRAKCAKMRLRPRPLGSVQRSPIDPLAGFGEEKNKEEKGKGKKGN